MSEDDDTILRRTTAHRGYRRPSAHTNQENERMTMTANNAAFARANLYFANAQRPTPPSNPPPRSPMSLRRNVTAPFNRSVPPPTTPTRTGIARRLSPEEKRLASRFIIQESARRAQEINADEPNPLPDQQIVNDSPTSPSPSQSQAESASLVHGDASENDNLKEVSESQAGPPETVSDVQADTLVATFSADAAYTLEENENKRGYSAPCPTPPVQRERSHLIELFGRALHMVRTGRLSMDRVIQAVNEGKRRGIEKRKRHVADPEALTAALLKYLDEKQEYQ